MRGKFAWYDLITPDVPGAFAFYTEAVGLGRHRWSDEYEMLTSAAGPIGGVEKLADGDARWLAYVECGDIEATVARVAELGGTVRSGPTDIPEVGRMAVIEGPTGTVVAAFQGKDPDWEPSEEVVPGALVWHECYAEDLDKAWSFWSALFGWEVSDSLQGAPTGEYRMYRVPGTERALGGMMRRPEPLTGPTWLYYFHVPEISAAAARVTAAGGSVFVGPMAIPGGEFTAICRDPQGALFALHSKENSSA